MSCGLVRELKRGVLDWIANQQRFMSCGPTQSPGGVGNSQPPQTTPLDGGDRSLSKIKIANWLSYEKGGVVVARSVLPSPTVLENRLQLPALL